MADKDSNDVSPEILPMERSAIHRISSGLGIFDLAGAVKELVENSLDAGANRIDIRLKDYGAHLIEVADNGPGVSPKNYQALTLKHYTSKISKYADLQNLSSFGFRGEALSSLCALSRVNISTKTANETVGTRLEYDLSGILVTKAPIARCVGTTVAISKLFFPLPVRENEFKRNIKREFGRLVTVLQAYALISKRIRLLCTNKTGKAGRTTVLQTLGSLSIRDNVVAVFGTKTIKCLDWIDLSISDECRVEGFLSKPSAGNGRGSRDRQFFFINSRLVDMPKAAKVLNELYRSFNPMQFPIVIINFTLPTTAYDINVSPDKRKVFLHNEGELLNGVVAALQKDYAPVMDATATTAKKKKKMVEPWPGEQAVPPTVRSNENMRGTIEPEADGGHSCGGLAQDDELEKEEVPIITTSESIQYGKHTVGDVEQDGAVEREEAPINSTSHPAGYGTDSCAGRGQDGNFGEDVPILSSSDLVGYGKQQLNARDSRFLKLKSSRRSLRLKSFGQDSGNAILSSDSLFGGPTMTSPLEVQPRTTVQCRLTELVPIRKRSLEESLERPVKDCGQGALCGLDNTNDLDKDTAKRQQIQPNNSRQTSLPCWLTGSEKSGESDTEPKSQFQNMRLRRNIEGPTVGVADFSPDCQAEVPSESPDETGSQQLDEELAKVSSMHTECGRGNELNDLEIGKENQKPLASAPEGLNHTNSVLRFNRLSAAEVKEAGRQTKDGSFLKFDMERLQMLSKLGFLRHEKKERTMKSTKKKTFTFATVSDAAIVEAPAERRSALEAATKELQKGLLKTDYKRMKKMLLDHLKFNDDTKNPKCTEPLTRSVTQVVGQFDLRFILVKLDQDIFILDQHASDEIYNFERMMRTSVLDNHPLPKSMPLELNAADQVILETHLQTFRKNGFDFRRKRQRSGGHKLHLSAVPLCANNMLGVEDVKELISSVASRPSEGWKCGGVPRPSRLRAIFASHACEASRRVGDALSKKEMEEVVYRLAELEAPQTCPNGQPTLRHMFDLVSTVKT